MLLFGLWWFFDMAFVWISPHSYEQYYLPLNASSAVLGGYFVGLYAHRFQTDRDRTRWIVLGLVGVLAMIVLSWHIFFGITKSPHSGGVYRDRERTAEPHPGIPAEMAGGRERTGSIPGSRWATTSVSIRSRPIPCTSGAGSRASTCRPSG